MTLFVEILKLICIMGFLAGINAHFDSQRARRQYKNLYQERYRIDSLITTHYDSLITTYRK